MKASTFGVAMGLLVAAASPAGAQLAPLAQQMEINVSTPHPYADNMNQTYRVRVPGARRLSVHISKLETEVGYDMLEFLDVNNASYGTWQGTGSDGYGPWIEGDTVLLKFTTDGSVTMYGFDADHVLYE